MRPKTQHIAEERKVFKRGGASPQLLKEEKAEYAKEGYKFANGGAVKARATTKKLGAACGCK